MEVVKREEDKQPEPAQYAIRWPIFVEADDHRYRVVSCGSDLLNGVWLEQEPAEDEIELCHHEGEQVEHPAVSLADALARGILDLGDEAADVVIPVNQILGLLILAGGAPKGRASRKGRRLAANA